MGNFLLTGDTTRGRRLALAMLLLLLVGPAVAESRFSAYSQPGSNTDPYNYRFYLGFSDRYQSFAFSSGLHHSYPTYERSSHLGWKRPHRIDRRDIDRYQRHRDSGYRSSGRHWDRHWPKIRGERRGQKWGHNRGEHRGKQRYRSPFTSFRPDHRRSWRHDSKHRY